MLVMPYNQGMEKDEAKAVNLRISYGQALQLVILLLALGGTWQLMRSDIQSLKTELNTFKERYNQKEQANIINQKEQRAELKQELVNLTAIFQKEMAELRAEMNRDRYYQYEADADKQTYREKFSVIDDRLDNKREAIQDLRERVKKLEDTKK